MPVVEFKVIETEPSPYCIVAPETVIHCQGEPIKREAEEALINEIGFDDIGGLEGVKQKLKEFIQYPIEHLEIYHKFGMAPSRGVLLYGPPGCGKFCCYVREMSRISGVQGKQCWSRHLPTSVTSI
jgi:transitional endoplasmic reticulum ATPase